HSFSLSQWPVPAPALQKSPPEGHLFRWRLIQQPVKFLCSSHASPFANSESRGFRIIIQNSEVYLLFQSARSVTGTHTRPPEPPHLDLPLSESALENCDALQPESVVLFLPAHR